MEIVLLARASERGIVVYEPTKMDDEEDLVWAAGLGTTVFLPVFFLLI